MSDIILPISPVNRTEISEVANTSHVDLFNESLVTTGKPTEAQPVLEITTGESPTVGTEFLHRIAAFQHEQNRVFSEMNTVSSKETSIEKEKATDNIREFDAHNDNMTTHQSVIDSANKNENPSTGIDMKTKISDVMQLQGNTRNVMMYFANFTAISSAAQAAQSGFKQLWNMQ